MSNSKYVPTCCPRSLHSVLAPGNPTVCRPLPYIGQYVTCLSHTGTGCDEPVQVGQTGE
jgi:hypothetical protein